MAFVKCKGTVLQQSIASVFTAVAQLTDIDMSGMKAETYEADTLDNAGAGILKKPTYRTDPGSLGFNLFLDPALAGHKSLLGLLTTPALQNWKLLFADTSTTTWPFTGAGFELGLTVALKDGLKAKCSIELADLPTFP